MAGIQKYNSPAKVQRTGNDSVYGTGSDGNTIISSNTSLSRDMYYNNLTINNGYHLTTNGFKVFVKGNAVINGSIGIKSTDSTISANTISGHTPANTAVTYSLGGSTKDNSATQISQSLLNDVNTLLSGVYYDTASTARVIVGGAGGPTGTAGTLDTNTAAPSTWPGKSGTSGSAGQYPPNAHSVGSPGGQGHAGTDGSAGSAGTYGTAGSAGAGGVGGPLVFLIAKNISGSGTVYSQAKAGGTGGSAVNGSAGSSGSNGSAGSTAPSTTWYGYINNYHHDRPAHHGGGDSHTVHMPQYHLPHYYHAHHSQIHAQHWTWHAGGNYFHHTHGYYTTPENANQTRLNDVNHDHHGNPSNTGGQHNYFAYMYTYPSHYLPGGHTYYWNSGKAKGYHIAHVKHTVNTAWSAGPALHSYYYTGTWPGGAGGSAGVGGPGGRAGTPTGGTDGYPGGGGGVLILTETTPSITIDTSGATSNSYSSSSGMQVIILN